MVSTQAVPFYPIQITNTKDTISQVAARVSNRGHPNDLSAHSSMLKTGKKTAIVLKRVPYTYTYTITCQVAAITKASSGALSPSAF